jgi:hypothetical protein
MMGCVKERKMKIFWIILISIVLTISFPSSSFGHGVGYELLDPVPLGNNKQVALEVRSSQYENPDNPDREIQFSLLDANTEITIRDVTYEIIGYKGEQLLFTDTFEAKDGIFVFVLLSSDSKDITRESVDKSSFFESLIGLKQETIHLSSSLFNTGGLYSFKVKILTAESFSNKLDPPIEYDVGLSIPQRTSYDIDDPNFADQKIDIITYYDEIKEFEYFSDQVMMSFSMPFDWSNDNINETSVVHEEFIFPKAFGDILVSEYLVTVNDIQVSNQTITIDDFAESYRTVHLVLNQNDLYDLKNKQEQNNNELNDKMNFVLKAKNGTYSSRETVTKNGQFRIILDWEPKDIRSGTQTTFIFDIMDVFLKNRLVSIPYDISLIQNGNILYSNMGVSTDSKEKRNEITIDIPDMSSGIATIQFDNLDESSYAFASIPIVIDRVQSISDDDSNDPNEIVIPQWIKNNARWWADGQINDSEFVLGIEFMIEQGIIKIPLSTSQGVSGDNNNDPNEIVIPQWIKNNARWWADGQINDSEFAGGIEFLVKNGVISI